jgi:hypothetical protein
MFVRLKNSINRCCLQNQHQDGCAVRQKLTDILAKVVCVVAVH